MKFYSGFSLEGESGFFQHLIDSSDYTVCGFSYGAIKALKYTKTALSNGIRVDRVQLFSPAFFQNRSEGFKKLQIRSFCKNEQKYMDNFIKACFLPYGICPLNITGGNLEELEELLYYEWSLKELHSVCEKGVKIEVYVGSEDNIVDAKASQEFFRNISTVTYIKGANHFLQRRIEKGEDKNGRD